MGYFDRISGGLGLIQKSTYLFRLFSIWRIFGNLPCRL